MKLGDASHPKRMTYCLCVTQNPLKNCLFKTLPENYGSVSKYVLIQLVNLRYEEVHRRMFELQKQDFTNAVIVAYTSVQTCEKCNAFVV